MINIISIIIFSNSAQLGQVWYQSRGKLAGEHDGMGLRPKKSIYQTIPYIKHPQNNAFQIFRSLRSRDIPEKKTQLEKYALKQSETKANRKITHKN